MQYNSKAPRVGDAILKDIWSNVYDPSEYLPTEDELSRRYCVSRMTLRKGLSILEKEGVLVKIPNCGTRISSELKLPGRSEPGAPGKIRIAAVVTTFPDLLSMEVTRGIRQFADAHNCDFVLLQSARNQDEVLTELVKTGCSFDGFLLLNSFCDGRRIDAAVKALKVPVVYVDKIPHGVDAPVVSADHFAGGYLAASHLLKKLGRPIFFFCESAEISSLQLRFAGFSRAMDDYGFSAKGHQISFDLVSEEYLSEKRQSNAFAAAEKLLSEVKFPCGIFAANDYLARIIATVAAQRNLELGKDLLLVGFDDLPFAESMKISSIRQDRAGIGREAAEQLLGMIEGDCRVSFSKLLPVQLVERVSSGGDEKDKTLPSQEKKEIEKK
ncbi:MAG: GntR family transcriptional regulator [Victivallaceae bacterium]|nr:GntR family transcriptional regulator [Victivallaceae bacterium]